MPAYSGTVTAFVTTSAWMTVGETVYIAGAGYMLISGPVTPGQVGLTNPANGTTAYPANVAPTTPVASGGLVTPAGIQGPTGALTGAAGGQLKGNYPNPNLAVGTTKGDLIVDSGAGGGTAARLAVGTDGTRLIADSTKTLGVDWRVVNLGVAAEITGTLPAANGGTGATSGIIAVANGGTGASTPAAARSNLGITSAEYNAVDPNNAGLVADGAYTQFPHGLGAVPRFVDVVLVNLTGEGGFSPGDEVPIFHFFRTNSNVYYCPFQTDNDATYITVFNSKPAGFGAIQRTPKLAETPVLTLTPANWQLKVHALV